LKFLKECDMKKILILLVVLSGCGFNKIKTKPADQANQNPVSSIYQFQLNSLDGEKIDFEQFKGKKLLLVNVASECGFTPQYADLQELHSQHGEKVIILGFPANNFGGQEPGTNLEIAQFCQKNYGVTFQMFEKISVEGEDQHPLYQWLSDKSLNGWNNQAPTWNFCKYLVNERGELIHFFGSAVKPFSEEILSAINR